MEEVEVKFLNIDVQATEAKLAALGAKKVGEYFYRRRVFDYPDLRLHKQGAWVRLRDEGERVTLVYKQRLGVTSHDGSTSDQSMEEVELTVDSFDRTAEFLTAIGLQEKFYEENRRVRWVKGEVEFDIDTWPQLPPYLEIEAPSWQQIDEAIQLLGLNPADKKIFSTLQVYKLAGIDELDYSRITFEGLVKKEWFMVVEKFFTT